MEEKIDWTEILEEKPTINKHEMKNEKEIEFEKLVNKIPDGWFNARRAKMAMRSSYREGAFDGRKECIDKACELYRHSIMQVKNLMNTFKVGLGDIIDIDSSVADFRQSMK